MANVMNNLNSLSAWRTSLRCALLAFAAALLAACGGAGSAGTASTSPGGSGSACTTCGTALVTLTDAPGDFDSYLVNVVSLQLTRADGTVVQTVPQSTQVDFAQLVDLSEIVSAGQIPAGRYVSASITLDYSAATIVVDNGTTGVTIAASNVIDGATQLPLVAPNPTQMTLSLTLPSSAPFVVTPGAIANLALDFNLAASNTITPSLTAPTTVTVNPVLSASLVPDATRQARVRGPLVSADSATASYVVDVHPFNDDSYNNGQFTVLTTSTTTYSINGTSYTGSAGFTQLAMLAAGTVTAAYGTIDTTTHAFTASSVLAGSSVAGTKLDCVTGTVLSRSGNTLVIANGFEMHANEQGMSYARQVTATVGSTTQVSEQGQSGTFTIADISVGQQLQLAGTLSTDSSGNVTLDATAGNALLLPTSLTGTIAATSGSLVTVNLRSLGSQSASSLVFAGTGTSSAEDAVASAYTVALPAALSASSFTSGSPARFTGFVTPFGTAPPDFNAITSISYANTQAQLQVRWSAPGVTAPFSALSSTQLSISQATLSTSSQDVLRIAFTQITPSTLTGGLSLAPDATAANPRFAIGHWSSWQADSYTSFSDFEAALATDLNGTTSAIALSAVGPYDSGTGVLSVDQMIVILNN